MGAALAFYTLFSIAPILVIAVAVAGYVFGPHVAETQVLVQLSGLIGDTGANAIRDLLLSAHYSDKKGFAAAVGIITLLIGATSVFGELQNTLGRIWNTPKTANAVVWWQYVRGRILSIGLVLGVGFLLLRNSGPDFEIPMRVLGVLILMPGIGFILSAGITWALAARLGLMPPPGYQAHFDQRP